MLSETRLVVRKKFSNIQKGFLLKHNTITLILNMSKGIKKTVK